MKSTKLLALIFAVALVAAFALTGCAAPAAETQAVAPTTEESTAPVAEETVPAGDKKVIGIAIYSMGADSCVALVADAKAAAEKLGWEIVLMDANGDPATQADQMATLVSQGVDAIFLNPTDTTSLIPSIQAAIDAEIPVVAGGMEMDQEAMDKILFFAGVDDYSFAYSGCKWIADKFNGQKAKVALVTGPAGTDPTNKTVKAMEDCAAGTDIEYVGSFDGEWDSAKAMAIAEDLMVKYPDLDAIYCQDHVMALGVASAIQDGGKGDQVAVVGACGITDYLKYVEDGTVNCFSYALLYECGGFAIETLADYWTNGTELARKYYAVPVVVTAENAAEAKTVSFDFLPAK
ncbi:MAG: sugar ABC transporter substrate-binding protein [Clostridia bacterium]